MYTVYTFNQPFNENMFPKIAHNRITQKAKSTILRELSLRMIAHSVFLRKNVAQRKQKFSLSLVKIALKSFVNGNLRPNGFPNINKVIINNSQQF